MSDLVCTTAAIPGTNLVVSSLCLGTMTFGDGADERECLAMYALARDAGLFFFDCANVYANGESERILGRLIAGHRAEVVITTKAFYPVGSGPDDGGLSPGHLSRELDASLERLGTDYVDIFYFHAFDADTPVADSLGFAREAIEAGKIRHLGVSNFAAWQVMMARWVGSTIDAPDICCVQPMYNVLKRQCEAEILPMAASEGIGVFSYGPLAGGLLTGKYDLAASGPRRLDANEMYRRRYEGERARASAFVSLARSKGIHPVQLAVAWAGAHPAVTAPIIGARTLEQLQTLLGSNAVRLEPDLLRAIDELSPPAPVATDRQEEAGEARPGRVSDRSARPPLAAREVEDAGSESSDHQTGTGMVLNQVTLPVTDVARAIAFYKQLGFRQIVDAPHYARFECRPDGPSFSLHVTKSAAVGNAAMIYFECEDVDAEVDRLVRAGVEIEHGPVDQRWLWREAHLRDPDGNRICLYRAGENRLHPPWRID